MKKCFLLLTLLCAFGVCVAKGTDRVLPDEVAERFGELYVFSQGRVCRLCNTCDYHCRNEELSELFSRVQSLPLFPYPLGDSMVWLASCAIMPAAMSSDELNFVRKLPTYMLELYKDHDYETLSEVIGGLKCYQLIRGGEALPPAFVDALDGFYVGLWNKCMFLLLLFLGLLSLVSFFRGRNGVGYCQPSSVVRRKRCWVCCVVMLVYAIMLLVVRWVVGRHVPLTSGHEVMLFLGCCLMLLGLVGERRHVSVMPASLIAGLVAFGGAAFSESTITALPAALDSPLLGFHVSITIFSYAIFALMAVNGVRGLLMIRRAQMGKSEVLHGIDRFLLKPGIVCLAVGIALGSIWAKSAWGAYWTWDPKETWALVTLIVYGMGLTPFLKSAKAHHIFAVVGFLFVLFTYFGVNYLLGGMHAYG